MSSLITIWILLSSDKETNQDNPWVDLLSDAVNSFETALTSKHSIACARESLSYAIVSGKLPPFMRWQLECRPNLWINKEFQELWKSKTNTIRDKILKSSVEFMDDKIGLAYYKLREIQGNTLNAIKIPPQRLEQLNLNSTMKTESWGKYLIGNF